MNTKHCVLILIAIFSGMLVHASQTLEQKLSLAKYLLENQSTAENLKHQTHYGFGFDTGSELGYSLKNAGGELVQAYIQQTSQRIFFVEFYERGLASKDIQQYLSSLNYIWVGTEKSCDYLNNGQLALTLCPAGEKGIRICVNLMPH